MLFDNDTLGKDLPFYTCQQWSEQLIAVKGYPLYKIYRSFSWSQDGQGWSWTRSMVFVCPRCLEKWAHLDFKHQYGYYPAGCLQPVGHFCGKCGPGIAEQAVPPGSLLIEQGVGNFDLPLLYALPEELLKREFAVHLRHLGEEI